MCSLTAKQLVEAQVKLRIFIMSESLTPNDSVFLHTSLHSDYFILPFVWQKMIEKWSQTDRTKISPFFTDAHDTISPLFSRYCALCYPSYPYFAWEREISILSAKLTLVRSTWWTDSEKAYISFHFTILSCTTSFVLGQHAHGNTLNLLWKANLISFTRISVFAFSCFPCSAQMRRSSSEVKLTRPSSFCSTLLHPLTWCWHSPRPS